MVTASLASLLRCLTNFSRVPHCGRLVRDVLGLDDRLFVCVHGGHSGKRFQDALTPKLGVAKFLIQARWSFPQAELRARGTTVCGYVKTGFEA